MKVRQLRELLDGIPADVEDLEVRLVVPEKDRHAPLHVVLAVPEESEVWLVTAAYVGGQ